MITNFLTNGYMSVCGCTLKLRCYVILTMYIYGYNLHAQTTYPFPFPYPYRSDTSSVIYPLMDRPEVLDSNELTTIYSFVHKEHVRYEVAMLKKQFNIDSLFPDSASLNTFLTNHNLIKHPELKGYTYAPFYKIRCMSVYREKTGMMYRRGFFEVDKFTRFIRKGNISGTISPDTIYPLFEPTEKNFAVYYNHATKKLQIIGGEAFLAQIPENRDAKTEERYFYAELYAHSRMIQYLNHAGSWNYLDYYMYSVPDTMGSLIRTKGKEYFYFTACSSQELYSGKTPQFCWLICVPVPKPEYSFWEVDPSHNKPPREVTIIEDWNNIEAICFRSDSKGVCDYCPGYQPGFPLYELRRTIKNNPDQPTDNMTKVRGVTKEEMTVIKKIPKFHFFIAD